MDNDSSWVEVESEQKLFSTLEFDSGHLNRYHLCLPLNLPGVTSTIQLAPDSLTAHRTLVGAGEHCSPISRGPENSKKRTQRGSNFEQKGDQKETLTTYKGTQISNFSELITKSEYVKIVEKPN